MRFSLIHLITLLTLTSALPATPETHAPLTLRTDTTPADTQNLFKRKGGGGKGSSGSGGSSSSGKGSSGGSSSTSSRPAGSSTSNTGGSTRGGTGVTPSYGGGAYYAGGASVPYSSGLRSPSGISPFLLGAGTAGLLYGGIWAYGAYAYPYARPYTFHNVTSNNNETLPVECLCQEYQTCSCDGNQDDAYLGDLVGNGSVAALDGNARVANVNGTNTLLVNGTLANGTTADSWGVKSADSRGLVGMVVFAGFVTAFVMV